MVVEKGTRFLVVVGLLGLLYELRSPRGAAPAPSTPTPVPMAVEVTYSLSAEAPSGSQWVVHFPEIPQDLVLPVGAAGRQTLQARAAGPVTRVSLTLTGPQLHESNSPVAPIQQGRADVGALEVRARKAPKLRLSLPTATPVAPPEDPMPVPSDSWDAN